MVSAFRGHAKGVLVFLIPHVILGYTLRPDLGSNIIYAYSYEDVGTPDLVRGTWKLYDRFIDGFVPTGKCHTASPSGGPCLTSSACESSSCKAGQCCNAKGKSGLCLGCGTNGDCTRCATGYRLSAGSCVTFTSSGGQCATDAVCESGSCKAGQCCDDKGKVGTCLACSTNGDCARCATGYRLSAGSCVTLTSSGGQCATDAVCESGSCKAGECCNDKGKVGTCLACSTNGDCARCATGYRLSAGSCVTLTSSGGQCTSDAACESGACKAGQCCNAKGKLGACLSCGNNGNCTRCATGYRLSAGSCVTLTRSGGQCATDAVCESGSCKAGQCCDVKGKVGTCLACSTNGDCARCAIGYRLSAGSCVTLTSSGGQCTSDAACESGACNAGQCCNFKETSACLGCGTNGDCIRCGTGYRLSAGTCTLALGQGHSCHNDLQCVSEICAGGYCCRNGTNPGHCLACGSLGQCRACDPRQGQLHLKSGRCIPISTSTPAHGSSTLSKESDSQGSSTSRDNSGSSSNNTGLSSANILAAVFGCLFGVVLLIGVAIAVRRLHRTDSTQTFPTPIEPESTLSSERLYYNPIFSDEHPVYPVMSPCNQPEAEA